MELERRALKVVERLLEDTVTEDFLVDCVCITFFSSVLQWTSRSLSSQLTPKLSILNKTRFDVAQALTLQLHCCKS